MVHTLTMINPAQTTARRQEMISFIRLDIFCKCGYEYSFFFFLWFFLEIIPYIKTNVRWVL